MGDDAAIVQAARVSYGRGTRRVSEDAGLIRYLMRHRHSTPFEMCEIKYHVKLPIFVARQWIRHRTANVNEYSARYSILDREFYIPAPEHLAAQSAANRQGRGDVLAGDEAAEVLRLLRDDATRTYDHYARDAERGRGRQAGRSHPPGPGARTGADEPDAEHLHAVVLEDRPAQPVPLPVAARRRPCAVRNPRLCRGDAARPSMPGSRDVRQAFRDYRLGAVTLSAGMLAVVQRMLAGETVGQTDSGCRNANGRSSWPRSAVPRDPAVIVCFGSINLDLIFPLPHLPAAGQTVLGPDMRIEPGGKGGNQAVAAARDGARVVFAGAVGRDALAEDALALLRGSGVDITRIARVDRATGCAAICVDPAGRNLISVASGANLAAVESQVEDALLGPDTILLLQREVDPGETERLIRSGRARGARIVLNLAPAGKLAVDCLRALDVLVVNEHEAEWLAADLGCGADAVALHRFLGVSVVVTLGERGLEAATASGDFRLPAHRVAAIDTTGAGDCFTGVLAAGLDHGRGFEPALRRAVVAAAICCTRHGTQGSLPLAAEIDVIA